MLYFVLGMAFGIWLGMIIMCLLQIGKDGE